MSKSQSSILDFVHQQEQQENTRQRQQLLDLYYIEYDNTTKPRILSKLFVKADSSAQKERYKSKLMHRYNERKIMDDPQIYKQLSIAWRKDRYLTSEEGNYISVVQDQELPTKFQRNERDKDSGKTESCNNKCRRCINNVEDISHIVAGCSQLSARYNLPHRHNEVAR